MGLKPPEPRGIAIRQLKLTAMDRAVLKDLCVVNSQLKIFSP